MVASFPPIVVPSLPASSPDDVALHPIALVYTVQTPAAAETQATTTLQGPGTTLATDSAVKTAPPNPNAEEFIPAAFKNGTSSTPYNVHGPKNSGEIGHGISEIQLPQIVERTFKSVIELQQKQNEAIIATHQLLTAAMTLPQLTITKFKGDPIEYNTFIMAFDARIRTKASTSSDLLYYLNQHLEDEPADLIQGCLHMSPDEGYSEARRLLQREYGDPYKISTSYLNKILQWSPVRFDDSQGLNGCPYSRQNVR